MKQAVNVTFCMALTMVSISHAALDNKRLQIFDDRKIGSLTVGIDGALIHDMLWVIDTVDSIQRGSKRHNTDRTSKKYELNGKWYSLSELAEMEEEIEAEDLEQALTSVKDDFDTIVTHFMQQFIVKTIVCNAVKEWCQKSDRPTSLLKRWVKANKQEFEEIYRNIQSAQSLNEFLTDLKEFLTDVIASCPRAWEDFLEHQEEYAARTMSIPYVE